METLIEEARNKAAKIIAEAELKQSLLDYLAPREPKFIHIHRLWNEAASIHFGDKYSRKFISFRDVLSLALAFPPSVKLAMHKDSCLAFKAANVTPKSERVEVAPIEDFTVRLDFACVPTDGHTPGASVKWLHRINGELFAFCCEIDCAQLAIARFERTSSRYDHTETIDDTCLTMTKAGDALRHKCKFAKGSSTAGHTFTFYNLEGEGSLTEFLTEAIARGAK